MSYTCVACSLVFDDQYAHKEHYSSDFHIHNLKLKCSGEQPVSLEFFESLTPQQSEATPKKRTRVECSICHKTFSSLKSYNQHCQSRKHIDRLAVVEGKVHDGMGTAVEPVPMVIDNFEILEVTDCLFCVHSSDSISENLHHMKTHHSFFIPDVSHITDLEGFLEYLTVIVGIDLTCIWCLNKGRSSFSCLSDLQTHMRDCGHSKINFSVFGDALAPFYDYESDNIDNKSLHHGRLVVDVVEDSVGRALVLSDGTRVYGRGCLLSHFHSRALAAANEPVRYSSKLLNEGHGETVLSTFNSYAQNGLEMSTKFRQRALFLRDQKRKELDVGVKQNKLNTWKPII
ncbi:hypothetical protein P9112_012912 [Eukaryota sp. TZLM1-RC]